MNRTLFWAPTTVALSLIVHGSPALAVTWTRFDNFSNFAPSNSFQPAVVARNIGATTDIIDVYTVSSNAGKNVLLTKVSVDSDNFPDGNPIGFQNLGGLAIYPVSALGWGLHQEVFAVSGDQALYHMVNDGAGWPQSWSPLGKPNGVNICSPPAVTS